MHYTTAMNCPVCHVPIERSASGIVARHVSPFSLDDCLGVPVRLIIAGSRTVHPSPVEITEALMRHLGMSPDGVKDVICGDADGADAAGDRWAQAMAISVEHVPVTKDDYKAHGRYMAPKMRNRRMAEIGDVAIVFWDGSSGGSADMVTRMVARGKLVRVVPFRRSPTPRSPRRSPGQ